MKYLGNLFHEIFREIVFTKKIMYFCNYTTTGTLEAMGESMIGSTLVVGGDGRYGVVEATDKIIKMAAANKVF